MGKGIDDLAPCLSSDGGLHHTPGEVVLVID